MVRFVCLFVFIGNSFCVFLWAHCAPSFSSGLCAIEISFIIIYYYYFIFNLRQSRVSLHVADTLLLLLFCLFRAIIAHACSISPLGGAAHWSVLLLIAHAVASPFFLHIPRTKYSVCWSPPIQITCCRSHLKEQVSCQYKLLYSYLLSQ